jgi:hypothetical protein
MQRINGTNMARKTFAGAAFKASPYKASARIAATAGLIGLLSACGGGNYAAKDDNAPRPGPTRKYDPRYDTSVFGEDGASLGSVRSGGGGILGGGDDGKARLPVNKYLWQGALDTLSFLPLASTDPFTGVIATDWGSTPEAPGERFKVTAYILNPGLSAAALKVAVFREVRNESGLWLPALVSADTARKLEDAILIRARQIRIAEVEGGVTG